MADTKISALTNLASITDTDEFVIVDDIGGTPTTMRVDASVVKSYVGAAYQPLDSDLTAIAALTTTAYGRAVLALADAAAAQTAFGLVIGTNVQAYDAELAALAGLTSAAAKGIQFTGSGTAGTYDLTAFAKTILDDADQATVQATLGLTPGTNVQAYDAELAALASTTSAADKFPYFTGSGTASTATITSAARGVLDDTTVALMRQSLGILDVWAIPVGDETTAITTGTAKVTWRFPQAFTVTNVYASLAVVSSSGIPTVDINEGGTTILSTKLTIDANEKTSTTAATAAVISDTAIAADAEMTIDIDVAGTGAAGLKVYIVGYQG